MRKSISTIFGGSILVAAFLVALSQFVGSQPINPGVQQNGSVTAGHCVTWFGTNQIQDGGGTCAAAAPVQSVFGRTGTVTAQTGDYAVAQVTGAAPITSPTFTGVPAAPTPGTNVNTTQVPTTAWVNTWFATLLSPTFTGSPAAPTQATGNNSTLLATTAWVRNFFASLGIWYNQPIAKTANYTVLSADCGNTFQLGGADYYALTLGAASGYSSNCTLLVVNVDTTRAKLLTVNGVSNLRRLYAGETAQITNQNNVWVVQMTPRYRLRSTMTIYFRPDGDDTSDCLASTATGACASGSIAAVRGMSDIDINANGGGALVLQQTCSAVPCVLTDQTKYVSIVDGGFVGGTPQLQGDCTTPSNYTYAPGAAVNAGIQITFPIKMYVCGFKFAGGANANYGMYVSGAATIFINGKISCGNITSKPAIGYANGACIGANSNGQIYLNGNVDVTANIGAVVAAYNKGFVEVGTAITATLSGSPVWTDGFAFVVYGGQATLASITFAGTAATGNRCAVAFNSILRTDTSANPTYFPGNVDCSIVAGTVSATTFSTYQ